MILRVVSPIPLTRIACDFPRAKNKPLGLDLDHWLQGVFRTPSTFLDLIERKILFICRSDVNILALEETRPLTSSDEAEPSAFSAALFH